MRARPCPATSATKAQFRTLFTSSEGPILLRNQSSDYRTPYGAFHPRRPRAERPLPYIPGAGEKNPVYATPEDIRQNWGVNRITKKTREEAESLLRAEVDTYDQYLTGNNANPMKQTIGPCLAICAGEGLTIFRTSGLRLRPKSTMIGCSCGIPT
jgi:hypothetical protein